MSAGRAHCDEAAGAGDPGDPAIGFRERYDAAAEVIEFFAADGISLAGKDVADIGCGTGDMDLGVVHRAQPARLVGFDLLDVDTDALLANARAAGLATELPSNLRFERCEMERLPAGDATFDYIFTWSAFEHVANPVAVLREVRRVLRPAGVVMIQVWPFFHSRHGSHMWDWFPEGFAQLLHDTEEIERAVRAKPVGGREWSEAVLAAYRDLNRLTVDDLHRYLTVAGLRICKVELLSEAFHVPPALASLPPSLLGISGVKLLAGAA